MSRGLFDGGAGARRRDNNERAALLKSRLSVEDVVCGLGLDEGEALAAENGGPMCPFCGGFTMVIAKSGETFACSSCDGTGDIITLMREVKQCGFGRALDYLEELAPGKGPGKKTRTDDRQGRLI